MKEQSPSAATGRIFGGTAFAFAGHLFATLTCATCWAIFGPPLALLFGSSGVAFLSTLRPLAPLSIAISSIGLSYSIYQLVTRRHQSKKLPYRMAAAFTLLSVVAWIASVVYVSVTFFVG
jgi:O-antigen/teichoic acid export membrane protein